MRLISAQYLDFDEKIGTKLEQTPNKSGTKKDKHRESGCVIILSSKIGSWNHTFERKCRFAKFDLFFGNYLGKTQWQKWEKIGHTPYMRMCYNVYVQNWSWKSDIWAKIQICKIRLFFRNKSGTNAGTKKDTPCTWECVIILAWITGHESGRLFL